MGEIMKELINSFKYAFNGIFIFIKNERNLKIHLFMMILVIIFGLLLDINKYEWYICIILFIVVISSEVFNTAIELTIDFISTEQNKKIKHIKDLSAGAVLITAIGSAIIGLFIFIPKILLII